MSARARTEVGARRLLLLGGQGAALLLGFAAFAATRLRRPSQASDRRLTLLGVPLWQRGLVVTTQAVLLTVLGVALAWGAATLAAAAIGEGELARHALLASGGVLAMALLALASTVAVVCALVVNADEPGRFGALDVIAAGLALAVAAALVRGAADTEEVLRGGGSGALLIALPVAVVAIVGIVAAPCAASARPPRRARLARSPADRSPRAALDRATAGCRGNGGGVSRRQHRSRGVRGHLPRDARAGPARPGGVRARRRPRAARGSLPARPGPRGRDAGAAATARPAGRRSAGAPRDGERRRAFRRHRRRGAGGRACAAPNPSRFRPRAAEPRRRLPTSTARGWTTRCRRACARRYRA